jgi:hypothetical protein
MRARVYKVGWGEYDQRANADVLKITAVSVTGGAVIAALICSVSLDHRERVQG